MNWHLFLFFAVLTVAGVIEVTGEIVEPSPASSAPIFSAPNIPPSILEAFNKFLVSTHANPSNIVALFLKFLKSFNNSINNSVAEATTAIPSILSDLRHILD